MLVHTLMSVDTKTNKPKSAAKVHIRLGPQKHRTENLGDKSHHVTVAPMALAVSEISTMDFLGMSCRIEHSENKIITSF